MSTSALFACSKCNERYLFEELSDTDHLCKNCQKLIATCSYCREEFHLESKYSKESICKRCARHVEKYGLPNTCKYCNLIAAFVGSKCERCTIREKKYGIPIICEQCQQKSAFPLSDKLLGKKNLCWLCARSYKRLVFGTTSSGTAKEILTKKVNPMSKSHSGHHVKHSHHKKSNHVSNPYHDAKVRHHQHKKSLISKVPPSNSEQTQHLDKFGTDLNAQNKAFANTRNSPFAQFNGPDVNNSTYNNNNTTSNGQSSSAFHAMSKTYDSQIPFVEKSIDSDQDVGEHQINSGSHHSFDSQKQPNKSPQKRPTKENISLSPVELSHSDHFVMVNKLQEEIETLKKTIQEKDRQLLERDKKITLIKAENFENEKEFRTKIQYMQKEHSDSIANFQNKNRDLQSTIAQLSKDLNAAKINGPSSNTFLKRKTQLNSNFAASTTASLISFENSPHITKGSDKIAL